MKISVKSYEESIRTDIYNELVTKIQSSLTSAEKTSNHLVELEYTGQEEGGFIVHKELSAHSNPNRVFIPVDPSNIESSVKPYINDSLVNLVEDVELATDNIDFFEIHAAFAA